MDENESHHQQPSHYGNGFGMSDDKDQLEAAAAWQYHSVNNVETSVNSFTAAAIANDDEDAVVDCSSLQLLNFLD